MYVSSEIPSLYMKNKCLHFSCFCDISQVTCQGGRDIDIFALNITVCVKHQLSRYPLRSVVINHKPRVQSHRQQGEGWQSLSWLQIVQPLCALTYHINLLICWKGLIPSFSTSWLCCCCCCFKNIRKGYVSKGHFLWNNLVYIILIKKKKKKRITIVPVSPTVKLYCWVTFCSQTFV